MLLRFDLIYADPPKQFTNSAKNVAGKLFENFVKMLGKHTIVEETEYFLPDEEQYVEQKDVEQEATSSQACEEAYKLPEKVFLKTEFPSI